MPTLNQLSLKGRTGKRKYSRVRALKGAPQKRGVIYEISVMSPRKPNSAKRKFVKLYILGDFRRTRAFAYIPGLGFHGLNQYNIVLLEGGGPKDSPGLNYTLLRGKLDFYSLEPYGRRNRRSKFGVINMYKEYIKGKW